MTKTEKAEKLIRLDELLINKMLEIMESGATEQLPELASVSNFLAKNMVVAEKEKSTLEDDMKTRLKKAEVRRASKKDA